MLHKFISDETGAITVDWIVVTSGYVALGLMMTSILSGGFETFTGNVSAELGQRPFIHYFGTETPVGETDFSDGATGWMGGTAATLPGFSEVLLIGPGSIAARQMTLPSGSAEARITFDLIGGDDLGGDPAVIYVNGQQVSVYRDNHGNVSHIETFLPGITVSVTQLYADAQMGGRDGAADSRARYTIIVSRPGDTLSFGIGSGANQGVESEFYAIDDFSVTTR